jgi:alkanesulfonate monooxygenase SsuD/methylene tetrahydromethanopterin reductase-like flavin-dependent oxidoreductase (luciferase family)
MPYSIFECFTAISALSALTSRITLGTLVACNLFRYPSMVAKMSATIDHISKGRFILGLGAGWLEAEFRGYGMPFPKHSERIQRLAEASKIVRKMWVDDKATYEGKYYQIREAFCDPKPLRRIPLWIGGRGEKLLDVVAAEGDGYNLNEGTVDDFKARLTKLRKICEEVGRDYDSIEKSWLGTVIIGKNSGEVEAKLRKYQPTTISAQRYVGPAIMGTPSDCIKKVQEYKDLGVTHFIGWFPDIAEDESGARIFAEDVMSSFRS